MKMLKSLFILACMTLTVSLAANDVPESALTVKTEIVDGTEMIVRLANLQNMFTAVTITSLDGETIYYRHNIRKHHGYSQKIHMDALADGRYVFEVKQGATTKKQVILIRDQQITLSNISG